MQPDLDFLFTFFIYSLRAITALIWGVVLLILSRRSRQNIPLGVIFTLIGLMYLRSAFVRFPVMDACDVYNPSSYIVLILAAPFTIFYAYFAFGEKHTLRHRLLHFIPFGVVMLLWAFVELSGEPRLPISYSIDELVGHFDAYPLYVGFYLSLILVLVAQIFCYFSLALMRIIRLWKLYKKHGLSLRPVVMLTIQDFLFMTYPLTGVFIMSYYNNLQLGLVFNILIPIIITSISVLNIMMVLPIKTDLSFMNNPEKKIASDYSAIIDEGKVEEKRVMFEKIKRLFEEKEIYRLPHLSLQDLAVELGTNRSYLSACINNYSGCNFKQFVCRYRIEATKGLLLRTEMDIQDIMIEVGFNSRSTFYSAFSENVCKDLSPCDWRQKMIADESIYD